MTQMSVVFVNCYFFLDNYVLEIPCLTSVNSTLKISFQTKI